MIALLVAAAKVPVKGAAASAAPALPVQVQQPAPAAPQTLSWFQLHAGGLTHVLAALFVLAAIALIALLAAQTTKQEGLSGTIGGRVESAYGRLGAEEQLKRITGVVAVAFVVIATILSLTGI